MHARRFIENDEFTVESLVQETYVKGWQMRGHMETVFHLFCFMRLNLSWLCLKWVQSPGNVFLRKKIQHTDNLEAYSKLHYYTLADTEEEARFFDEERLGTIEKVLPYLTPERQTMIDLYFKQGLSYKTIAKRFATSNMAVHHEVRRGLEHLKTIINCQQKTAKKSRTVPTVKIGGSGQLDAEMSQIFRLRLEYKMGFASIAEKLGVEQNYVKRKYVEAHSILERMGMAV